MAQQYRAAAPVAIPGAVLSVSAAAGASSGFAYRAASAVAGAVVLTSAASAGAGQLLDSVLLSGDA